MGISKKVKQERRKALNPEIWRDKTYVINLDMNDSPNTIVENSATVDSKPFILDFITWNTIGYTQNVEMRFSAKNVAINPKFADARLLFGSTQNQGKVLPLIDRLLFYPGERMRMEARNQEGGAPCITQDYTLEICFQGFEKWQ